jgi:hypothetical protein
MDTASQRLDPALAQDLFLLGRDAAIAAVNRVFSGEYDELCLRTRFPRELDSFIGAILRQRNELETGIGQLCLFVDDRDTWVRLCETEPARRILIAGPELDFEVHRTELMQAARMRKHGAIYAATTPRPDVPHIADLNQPQTYQVQEILVKHRYSEAEAAQFAQRSNGNVYLLAKLLTHTAERRKWSNVEIGYQLRHLALLGGWNEQSIEDCAAISEITDEPYDGWSKILHPLTIDQEPPVLAEGSVFRPVARYETWQQLSPYLRDADLMRFQKLATKVLGQIDPRLDLPSDRRSFAILPLDAPRITTGLFRKGLAESLALLAGQKHALKTSAGAAEHVADSVVSDLLDTADWKRWATLSRNMPLLAEAAPNVFLAALDRTLSLERDNPIQRCFGESEDPLFGRTYHTGLLWALEVLAWHGDYLSRVALCLARMVSFPLPSNMGNNPLNSLRSIFLTWLPQTLASVEQRHAAVRKVVDEYPDVGWKLLLAVLPERHQIGSYNPRPVWRDWFQSAWTGNISRREMVRQILNYSHLAAKAAASDVRKLDELIQRWDQLPRESVDEMLSYLTSPAFAQRSEDDRFVIWERLVNEVEKHRKYANSDWAMPEEELRRLESVATVIQPQSVAIRHQRLFDEYDHHFFESDDYENERRKLAELRSNSVREIVAVSGLPGLVEMAKKVKMPAELGEALGRIGDEKTDEFVLPKYLLSDERNFINFACGYVWARYFTAGSHWSETVKVEDWSPEQKATFFAFLPFHAVVWRRAEQVLGEATSEYWKRIYPNAFQAGDDLKEGVEKAIEFKRGDIAVSGINCLRFKNQPFAPSLALSAVNALLASYSKGDRIDQHELIEAIKVLQQSGELDVEELSRIEFMCLSLLDRFSGAAPIVLERRLATDAKFFHSMVSRAFRSEHADTENTAPSGEKDEMAGQVFRLLYRWQTPPGTIDNEHFDQELLKSWIAEAEKLCVESGHWKIAQQLIGTSFVYAPLGVEGLLKYTGAAKILDRPEFEEMRRGFTTGLFNLRGVHGYTAGKEELELATTYHQFAAQFEAEGFVRIATTLRNLSESYKRESEREAKQNPYQIS